MGYVVQNSQNMELKTRDTNSSHVLSIVWNEDEATTDRTLNVEVNGADRTIDLSGNLTVEGASVINQDLTTDASPTFAGITIDAVSITDISTDGSMGDNSNAKLPTQKAVKTYVDGKAALSWNIITGNTSASVGQGYITNNAGTWVITLPGTCAVGNQIAVVGGTSTGWQITAATGDTIRFGNLVTIAGGSIKSRNQHDAVLLVCTAANSSWKVENVQGSLDIETT